MKPRVLVALPLGLAVALPLCSLAASRPAASAASAPTIQRLAIETTRTAGIEPGQPSVAVDPREGFVLTWQERERASGKATLWFAVLDRDGRERRRGQIAAGGDWFVNWADFPSLEVLENGDWVSHYLQKSAGSPYAYDLRVVRSMDAGRTWGKPVTPHTDGTETQHGFVTLEALEGDRVLVVWLDGRHGAGAGHDDGPMSLRTAVLNRAGRTSEEQELDDSTCSCCQTDLVRIQGRTLAAYRDRSASEIRDIAIVSRTDEGAWSKPRILHADGWRIEACPVNGPALAANGERWLAAWPTQAAGVSQIRYVTGEGAAARVLDAGAQTIGRVDAAPWTDGFLVTWLGGSGKAAGLQLARVGVDGHVLARRTVAAVPPTRMSGNPRLASFKGRALLAWIEPDPARPGNALAIALLRAP